ncbi:MAG: hypothetical protein K9L60_03860 [Methylovulum sp.]|jgi:hypothetical protein|nr:hypothetical protein [Methylovulum sp.]MCF7997684.1 hypothetical protein [Methylovulum sp.]
MKKIITLVLLSLASIAQSAVLLERVKIPGNINNALSESCTISDKGLLTQRYQISDMSSKRTRALVLSNSSILAKIDLVAPGNTHFFMLPDVGGSIYRAYQKQADKTLKPIILNLDEGNFSINDFNADALMKFIDINCDH